jgi:hypothetical protein
MGIPSPMPWSSCVLNWGWPITIIETLIPVSFKEIPVEVVGW